LNARGRRWHLAAWWPAAQAIDHTERWRMVGGGFVGILLTALVAHAIGSSAGLPWIVAPMGASAVIVFGLPASPLAQPWAVVAGNTVSALVGIACVHWIAPVELAAAAAVGLAIAAMLALRCLHPPGGATALLMVLGGVSDVHAAFAPVFVNAALLVGAGLIYNNATGRRYPHEVVPPAPGAATEEALDAVLARYNQVLDVSRDELRVLLDQTRRLAHERRLADMRCADVMSREVVTVEYGTSLADAWLRLHERGVKALPVLDRGRHVVGILTLADFLRGAGIDSHVGFDARLRRLMRPSGRSHSDHPEVVGQIMTRKVRVTRAHRTLSDLVALFDSTGHRHIPVIGEDRKLVGMVTQAQVIAALMAGERRPQAER
jgi:CBS domain-containing membrane protein